MNQSIYDHPDVQTLIRCALDEDLRGIGDITCQALVPPGMHLHGLVRAKANGVVCGLPVFQHVFSAVTARCHVGQSGLGGQVSVSECRADGDSVQVGDIVLRCHGDAATMLIGERTALNICQRLSGTATMARQYADAVRGTRAQVLDTRKTTPGLRLLEKHAVQSGGCHNHRIGLYDQVLIKDNHIALMATDTTRNNSGNKNSDVDTINSPAEAVRRARRHCGVDTVIEVEIEHLADLAPVIAAGADIVLLDNMEPALLRQAVIERDRLSMSGGKRVALEASGGITLATIRAVAETGVDRISTGALTHSVQALDLSMRCTSDQHH